MSGAARSPVSSRSARRLRRSGDDTDADDGDGAAGSGGDRRKNKLPPAIWDAAEPLLSRAANVQPQPQSPERAAILFVSD